jgi:hypothetical protein
VAVELVQEGAQVGVTHGARHPRQVVVAGGQQVGLLVVQVLDAVLHPAQEDVGARQRLGGLGGHQAGAGMRSSAPSVGRVRSSGTGRRAPPAAAAR